MEFGHFLPYMYRHLVNISLGFFDYTERFFVWYERMKIKAIVIQHRYTPLSFVFRLNKKGRDDAYV